MTNNNLSNNPFIVIAAIVGGMCLGAIVLVGVFSPDKMAIAAWIVAALSLMGTALGYFSRKGSE